MGSGEEYLFDIGDLPGRLIDTGFIIEHERAFRRCSPFHSMMSVLANGCAVAGNCGVYPLPLLPLLLLLLGFPAGEVGWDELDAVFVQGYSMPEVLDGIIRGGECEVLWNQSDRVHSVPTRRYEMGS